MNDFTYADAPTQLANKRRMLRTQVEVPALASTGSGNFSVSIMNISRKGALIETSAVLPENSRLAVTCGTLEIKATVTRNSLNRNYGLKFDRALQDPEFDEQIQRSGALASRRQRHFLEPSRGGE